MLGCRFELPGDPSADASCSGHRCASDVALTDEEGGNLIFEYIQFDTELAAAFQLPVGVTTITRVMAYFMNAHDPNRNPMPEPGRCFNMIAAKGWPMYIAPGTMELDVGDVSILGVNEAGAPRLITLSGISNEKDSIGRTHAGRFYQTLLPDATQFMRSNSAYTVKLGGVGPVPASQFEDALFVPEKFQVTSPGIEANGPINSAQDFTVGWTPAMSSSLPAGATVQGVIWLVDATGSPTHMCPTLHSQGTFTIPAAALIEHKAIVQARGLPSSKVILGRNAIVHQLVRLPNGIDSNKRRIDLLGSIGWWQLMDVN